MSDFRTRALSAPNVRTTGWQPLQQQHLENVIPPIVKKTSEEFPRLPIPKKSNMVGSSKRTAYGEKGPQGRRNTKWMARQNVRAFGQKAYKEIFDTGRSSSSENEDAVTTVGNLDIRPLSLLPSQDEEVLTNEQQQQVTETFEQLGDLAGKVEAMFAQEMTKIKTLPPDERQRVLVSVAGLLERCQGKETGDPEVEALLSAIHRITHEDGATLSLDIPSDRIKSMMHPAMQLAELKHLQDIISDPSFNAEDPVWKKFLVRWPLNFLTSFVTVGMTVLLWTLVRGLIGNFIKSGFPDIASAAGMNATENWNVTDPGDPQARNSTFTGNSTLPPQHQGGTAWGAATAAMVMIPQLFNLVALVRDGRDGSAQGHVQVSRIIQFGLCVTALSIGFSMPATGGQGLAAAWTVATFADVLKGLLYSVGRDSFNYFWPKVRPNAETLTVKAVVQDAMVYFGTQTLLGIAFGYFAGIKTNTSLHLPFFGYDLTGGDLAALGAMSLGNSVVETIDEISLAYFMRNEDKKQFMKNVIEKNEEGIRQINERKEEFIKQKLLKIVVRKKPLVSASEWKTDLDSLTEQELNELAKAWEKEARLYVKEHLTGLVMKLPTWEQTKAKVTDCTRLIDFMFKGRLTTNRAAAMATAFFFSSTVLDAMAHPEDPTFDRAAQAVSAAATIIAVYLPGILACNRRGFDNPKPADMTHWQAIKYFMGFLVATDVEKEGGTVELLSVRSEEEINDPPPPNYFPESPPINLGSPRSVSEE